MDIPQHEELLEAATAMADAAQRLLSRDGRLQAESLIVSQARLAGSVLFRSFAHGGGLPVGAPVLSEQADAWGPRLLDLLTSTLRQLGDCPSDAEIRAAVPLVSPAEATLGFQESLDRLLPFQQRWSAVSGLDPVQSGVAAAIATALLVRACQQVLPLDRGVALAAAGFSEGLRTVPARPATAPEQPLGLERPPGA